MRFDLETWGDGMLSLAHWDSLHGDDVIIRINSGAAYLCGYDDDGNETLREINLVAFLENLKERIE